jgi:KipI family sensor histidine kinase inhibitor
MTEYRVLTAGDTALVIEFGDRVDRRLSSLVLALAQRLDERRPEGVVETVPTFRSLMIHYDPLVIPAETLVAAIDEIMQDIRVADYDVRTWRLPVCYDPAVGLDLDEVAARTGLSPAAIAERHASVPYHVYMLGFLPGLAYMGDVPAELALPRRQTPRPHVPAGAVAIATTMSIIFPRESPTGWYVIGRSPVPLWRRPPGGGALRDRRPGRPVPAGALLAPGDQVTFVPVSLREYEELAARAAAGGLDAWPAEAVHGAAA